MFYSSYNNSIQGQMLSALRMVVETHKRDIDGFLTERLPTLQAVGALLGNNQPETARTPAGRPRIHTPGPRGLRGSGACRWSGVPGGLRRCLRLDNADYS
ncbi:hypothetical protein DFAR_4010010 [Desulfarculales bacterium]